MKHTSFFHILVTGVFLFGNGSIVFAQQTSKAIQPRVDLGKVEYESNCATCHGLTGKGDGPSAGIVNQKIADLTTLANTNGGILPVAAMYDVISGERELRGHGPRDMPLWGRAYRIKAAEYYMDAPYDAEAYVRARILALIEYINRLQVK